MSPWNSILKLLAKGLNYTWKQQLEHIHNAYVLTASHLHGVLKCGESETKNMAGKLLVSHCDHKDALVDGKFRGKVLITAMCSHTICFANKHWGGCQRGIGITIKVVNIEQRGEWCCWASTCIPQSLSNYPDVFTILFPPTFSPDLTHACGVVGFARLAAVSNQL